MPQEDSAAGPPELLSQKLIREAGQVKYLLFWGLISVASALRTLTFAPWLVSPNCRADVRGGAHLPVLPDFSLAAEAAGPHALPAGGTQGNSVSLQPKRVETLHVPFSL